MDAQQRRTETPRPPPIGEPGGDVSSIFIAFGVFAAIAALVSLLFTRLIDVLRFDHVYTRILN